jgi:predicted esterase
MRQLLLLALVAIVAAGEAKPTYEPVDWSAEPVPGRTGEYSGELKNPKTRSLVMRYKVHAPTVLPAARTLGLIVGFHGLGGNEEAALGAYWPMKGLGLDEQYVFIGGKSTGNGWEPADEDRLMQFIDWAETVYPIDHRRVFFWGHSNGGWAVGNYGARHADRVAGIVRWAGYGVFLPQAKDPAASLTEYYLVHGDADPTVNVSGSRTLRQALLPKGIAFVYREIDGGDHGSILGVAPVSRDAARWVHFLRHKTIPPPADDIALLKPLAKGREAEAMERLAKPEAWADLVRIGSPCVWPIVARALKAKEATVRLAGAEACARTAFAADEAVAALTVLLDDADAGVRAAAIAALGVHANWRRAAAQLALGKMALQKKALLAERTAAATALAAALPLPFYGNYDDDGTAFEGIVALLGCDELDLRRIAFAPLQAAVADGLGYDPAADAASRAQPIAAWKMWFGEHAAPAGKAAGKKK